MCWYCTNGLPPRVKEIFDRLEAKNPRCQFGPGHIVFSDYNLADHNIKWCIEQCETDDPAEYDYTPEMVALDRAALVELLAIPESERDPAPPEKWEQTQPPSNPPEGETVGKLFGYDVVMSKETKTPMTDLLLCDIKKMYVVIEDEYGRAKRMLRSDYERVRKEHPELGLPEIK